METWPAVATDHVHASFLELFHQNEGRLRALTRALVVGEHDAQDVFQESLLTMFKKFPERDHSEDFVDWGFRVISFKVRELKQKKRRLKWQFSEETLHLIADEAVEIAQEWSVRSLALRQCLERLPPADRQLLTQRYEDESAIEDMALRSGRTVQAVYRKLSRLRQALAECVRRTLSRMHDHHGT